YEAAHTESSNEIETSDGLEGRGHSRLFTAFHQAKRAAASPAIDILVGSIGEKFDRIAAMRATNVKTARVGAVRRMIDRCRSVGRSGWKPHCGRVCAGTIATEDTEFQKCLLQLRDQFRVSFEQL